jgi:hypothetical protein
VLLGVMLKVSVLVAVTEDAAVLVGVALEVAV